MNLGRILANAFARRIAVVVVALVLAWLGLGTARAQSHPNYANQAAAYSACQSDLGAARAAKPTWTATTPCTGPISYNSTQFAYECEIRSPGGTYNTCKVAVGGTGGRHYLYLKTTTCSATASSIFSHDLVIPTGSVGCQGGCAFQVVNNGDGTYSRQFGFLNNETCQVLPACTQAGWYLNHATSMCQPPEVECPGNKTKNPKTGACEEACPTGMVMDPTGVCKPAADDCPAGNVRAPSGECLPGEGQCAAGEARRPNGTCGTDADGDGVADDDDDDPENDTEKPTFSGGDTCSAPPSCSGGAIDCGMARIQWRIDCNTRRDVNITGGACSAMPVCVGENCKAMEYSQLLQQWKAACALEKLANAEPGEGGENEGVMDPVSSGGVLGEDGYTGETARRRFGQGSDYQFDVAGYGWGMSCPAPPDVSVFGHTLHFDTSAFCSWMSVGGIFVMIMAHFAGLAILWRA